LKKYSIYAKKIESRCIWKAASGACFLDLTYLSSATLQLIAVVLQLIAALFALKLIRITEKGTSWILISAALCLMAMRRSVSLWDTLVGNHRPDLIDSTFAVAISVIMLAGVFLISPLFHKIKEATETLSRAKDDLEIQVAQRTEELRDANIHLAVELDERRRAEQQLTRSAGELARSNAELEQFAYVASHDLQEPLRMVASFTQLLGKRYRGQLDQDAHEFIDYAVDGAHRMQRLINDLLAYSRVGTRGISLELLDCNVIFRQARENLGKAVEESGALVFQDSLPEVKGDEVQLLQLFQNLLANAIKFRGPEPPQIQVSAEQRGQEWVFSIRDNGIGIAPEHQKRIFSIFQRLHHRSEYPGTGIGLAICNKIVERHGGRIWVESRVGEGSTFYFTIPGEE
jgi:light-regulated signal transduction histidine kinase (bacteriophytochrome)